MPPLPAQSRKAILAAFMEEASAVREPLGLSKPDLQQAINAADAEMNRQAGGLDDALPAQAQAGLSRKAKDAMFRHVSQERWKTL